MKSEAAFSVGPLFRGALDFLLPPLCFGCGQEVEVQGGLCPPCWAGLNFITEPYCSSCGFPFSHDMPEGVLCASCHQQKPRFKSARSAIAYNQDSRPIVLSFKYGGRTEGLETMSKWLAQAASDFISEVDIIIPVPLHGRRLFSRKFNQSALLAGALETLTAIPANPFILKRTKNTRTQGGLNRRQREKNVSKAFAVDKKDKILLKGKTVLLIDDVFTTGATVDNCTKALQKAGAKTIYVLTLARVVEPMRKKTTGKTKVKKSKGKKVGKSRNL
ncbi:MAG: ComF family protein [Sphingomonadales bacterium]